MIQTQIHLVVICLSNPSGRSPQLRLSGLSRLTDGKEKTKSSNAFAGKRRKKWIGLCSYVDYANLIGINAMLDCSFRQSLAHET